jgi:hypothetical protein
MLGSAAPGSPDNPSYAQFSWQISYSATTGYMQELGENPNLRQFKTASSVTVQIEKQNSLVVTYLGDFPNGAPAFPKGPEDGKPGLILAQADETIPTAAQQSSEGISIHVGIGMNDKPTVVVQHLPNLLYQFTPKPTYYIISGSFKEGQVIDTATSTQAFEVKFQGVTNRTLIFTEENQFKSA